MHARLQLVRTMPQPFTRPGASSQIVETIERHPGFRGIHLMLQLGTRQGLSLTLWDSREDAEAAPERTHAVLGPRPFPLAVDGLYDVLATLDGPDPLGEATVCQLNWFDGPRSAVQNEAMRRAGDERIAPAVQHVPGFVRTYVLCDPDDSAIVVVTLATSTEALERITDAVFSTTLLPGEDPALLDDPDRVEVYRIHSQSLAQEPVA